MSLDAVSFAIVDEVIPIRPGQILEAMDLVTSQTGAREFALSFEDVPGHNRSALATRMGDDVWHGYS